LAAFAQASSVTPVAACRQLASSGRRRVRTSQAPPAQAPRQGRLVRDFKRAWEAKDINALIGLLDPGATVTADGGGLVSAHLRPIEGAEQIARYLVEALAPARVFHRCEATAPGATVMAGF
jgi:RNA polymerase sigma-70 factor (ECF subfamily)